METRLKMTLSEFKSIGPYDDESYLTFNYEETLFEHIRVNLLNLNTSKETYASLTTAQKIFWGYISLSSQIRNGGIAQYYWNTDGEYLNEISLNLNILNDVEFTKMVNNSVNIFKENKELLLNYKALDQQHNNTINYYELWVEQLNGEKLNDYFFLQAKKFENNMFNYILENYSGFIK